MPPVLTRHLLAEIYGLMVAVTGILVLVYLSNQLARYLAQVAEGRLAGELLLALLGLKLASVLVLLLPAAFFVAALLALGRMVGDSEMVALAASGIGPGRLRRMLLLAATPVTLLTAVLALQAGPWAAALADQVLLRARSEAAVSAIVPGRFMTAGQDLAYQVEGVGEGRRLLGLFAHIERPGGSVVIRTGDAQVERDPETGVTDMVLGRGTRYDGEPGQGDFRVFEFERYRIRLPELGGKVFLRPESQPTALLLVADNPVLGAELHWRIALPVSVLVLALLAVPLGQGPPRQGRYGRLVFALLVYIVYVNLLGAGRNLLMTEDLPGWFGLWWAHLPPLLLAWGLARRQAFRPWLPWRGGAPA